MREILIYLSACIVAALFTMTVLRFVRPQWGVRRTSMLAALPIPVLTIVLCAVIVINAYRTPAGQCGVDACGMAIGLSMIAAIIALGSYVVTWAVCALVMIFRARRRARSRPSA